MCRQACVEQELPRQGWREHLNQVAARLAPEHRGALTRQMLIYFNRLERNLNGGDERRGNQPIQEEGRRQQQIEGVHAVNALAFTGIKGKSCKKELLKVLALQCS